MSDSNDKTTISDKDLISMKKILSEISDKILDMKKANIVGIGIGLKEVNGVVTEEPSFIIFVTKKVKKSKLDPNDMIPESIQGYKTDVIAIGRVSAGRANQVTEAPDLTARIRPAMGGFSVGHIDITAGTIATCVYDILPRGIGIPDKFYILSNNHVLADENRASIGDPILQPGPLDGGKFPKDQIAVLSRFVPITFYPPVPLNEQNNLVDAAIAEGNMDALNREIYWIGYLKGWMKRKHVKPGMIVKKTGRTTGLTFGRIRAVNATVDINYGEETDPVIARFRDQIVTTIMDEPGDSGSLVTTLDNIAVGLLFAGSEDSTIINHIEYVRRLLGVEIAERAF